MAPKRPAVGALGAPTTKLKQGTLFSFFAKKQGSSTAPSTTATNNSVAATPALTNASASATASAPPLANHVPVGSRLQVLWKDDKKYLGTVTQHRDNLHLVEYDHGPSEWLDLQTQKYELTQQRRRLTQPAPHDSSEEEAEFDMDDDDDEESAYEQDPATADGDEDDDDDQWMVTDDEDDLPKKKKKRLSKKNVKVTEHKADSKTPARSVSSTTNSSSLSRFSSSSVARTPKHVTPAVTQPQSFSQQQTPLTVSTTSTAKTTHHTPNSIPQPEKGAVNPAGSHIHNHLKFLQNPRDAASHAPDHPDYDPRTLRVNTADWKKIMGADMTHAVKQWWDLKAQYYDTVLLFKTGKFYEMFHMDADVGVQVLGLLYMKGQVAHAGFPEISYGTMADKLVRAGYKVARVEQTETPDMLKERKKRHKGKGAPKVVNREVCSILTLGTRTFCYLDDDSSILQEAASGGSVTNGPLLAICEVLLEPTTTDDENVTMDDDEQEEVQPVCEYGITLIDAVRGTITLGQFADDVLRTRMDTLLAAFAPSEILLQGGEHGASPTLVSLIRSVQTTSQQAFRVETIRSEESFPKSTAIDAEIRRKMERRTSKVHPWQVEETLQELHRRKYYPRAPPEDGDGFGVSRWPQVLRAAVEGEANLCLSSFGAALFYLQRNLIDHEILSMGVVKAYVPPESSTAPQETTASQMSQLAAQQNRQEAGVDNEEAYAPEQAAESSQVGGVAPMEFTQQPESFSAEDEVSHMSLDGTTLHNLEILTNSVDYKTTGSLWSKINYTKTPHGSRLLRAWLLRPLFRKAEIDRRADAVQELVSGGAALALSEVRSLLAKCGDIERLLARIHSMSGTSLPGVEDDESSQFHPNDRAVLYETATYTKRKVSDFSKVLHGLRRAAQIPELFNGVEIQSGLLSKIVRHVGQGGCFPSMEEELDWFFTNFDSDQAAKGLFEPSRGIDDVYDDACDTIERIQSELADYKTDMCSDVLRPQSLARSSWKYVNVKPESKDKYLIELPASVSVPDYFIMKGKRGSGHKQVNKYRTADVAQWVQELEQAIEIQKERKARGLRLIFAKFDAIRAKWAAAAQATALLDALGSLSQTSSKAGYSRPKILDCPPDRAPCIRVTQGRHPCVENTTGSTEFIPNDLSLGSESSDGTTSRVLLLSGPNMGGKSTLLRQTCLIAILAQIGSFVPAVDCELTPIDRIYTRLGASDRLLLGQSTFFVELAETAAALRGATRRSLVIMDELGRGTSTFDGTAIASAAVKHLAERSKCLSLFATHYHSLLDEWKNAPNVRLGHMECIVENGQVTSRGDDAEEEKTITFLYTLGEGVCPKSFGINVARLAGLPEDVLSNAKRVSADFEQEMNEGAQSAVVTARSALSQKQRIIDAIKAGDTAAVESLWESLQK